MPNDHLTVHQHAEHLETEKATSLFDWLKSVPTGTNLELILERLGFCLVPSPIPTFSHLICSALPPLVTRPIFITVSVDRASQVLADGLPAGVPPTYLALSEWGQVPYSTVYHRAHGRRSKEDKAKSQLPHSV
jgi:hypothetical protein